METINPSYFYQNNKIERQMCMEIMNKKYSKHIGAVIIYPKKPWHCYESSETNLKRVEKIFDPEHGK